MRVVIVGSMHFYREMQQLKEELIRKGHSVFAPGDEQESGYVPATSEIARRKRQYDVFTRFHAEIAAADAVVCYNQDKNSVQGYIGANAFIELAFGAAHKKKLYAYFPLPRAMPYHADELAAMDLFVCNGDPNAVGADI